MKTRILRTIVTAFVLLSGFSSTFAVENSGVSADTARKLDALVADMQTKLDALPKQKALTAAKTLERKVKALSLKKYKNDTATKAAAVYLAAKLKEMRVRISERVEEKTQTTDYSELLQAVNNELQKADSQNASKTSTGNSFMRSSSSAQSGTEVSPISVIRSSTTTNSHTSSSTSSSQTSGNMTGSDKFYGCSSDYMIMSCSGYMQYIKNAAVSSYPNPANTGCNGTQKSEWGWAAQYFSYTIPNTSNTIEGWGCALMWRMNLCRTATKEKVSRATVIAETGNSNWSDDSWSPLRVAAFDMKFTPAASSDACYSLSDGTTSYTGPIQ